MVLPSDFDPRRAQLACSRIMRTTAKGSTAMSNVYDIPKFWINLEGLAHASNMNAIEACITRVYCMQGALNFHHWLVDIIQNAVESMTRRTWIERLASDVEAAINQRRTVTFHSTSYLPNLTFHKAYSYVPSKVRYVKTEIHSVVSSIVRYWLHFPTDERSLLQLSLLDILVSHSPASVLFLDHIWEMYATPFSTVFNVWNARTSKTNIDKSLVEFRKQFSVHPFATAGSLEYRKLEYLSELITKWMGNNIMETSPESSVRTSR